MAKWEAYARRKEDYLEVLRRIATWQKGPLNLRSGGLKRIPEELGELTDLSELDLTDNQISELGPLRGLTELNILNLRGNQISELGPLGGLTELKSLDLYNNQISDLGALGTLIELTKLNLAVNQISDLGPLGRLTKLKKLDLHRNQINELAPLVGLTELTSLNLASNQVSELGALGEMTELYTLHLRNNQISELGPLEGLTGLTELILSRNQINELKPLEPLLSCGMEVYVDEENGLKKGVYLKNNPLTDPPLEIARQGPEAILRYWETQKRLKTKPNYTGRILLLGDGAAGKSSLSDKLHDDKVTIVEGQRKRTEGIDIKEVLFPVGDNEFTGRVWDLGGQEDQHVLHQYFFGRRSLYVVVVNERKDTQHYDRWLRMIDLLGQRAGEEKTPVLVLFNVRGDLRGADVRKVFLNDYNRTYDKLDLIGCGINLGRKPGGPNDPAWKPLREQIGKALSELPLMGEMLSSNLKLLEWVEEREEHYVKFADFKAYATSEEVGLISDADVIDALNFLHALGEVVYYDELSAKSILRDSVFLDPQWIVDALYRILRLENINKVYGRFTRRLLHKTWEREGYSEKDIDLLEMLLLENAFELCYRVEGDPDYDYLYPGALAENPDVLEWEQLDKDHIRFRLEYPGYVPAGLMTRFLVRRHRQIDGSRLYRHGSVLRNQLSQEEEEEWLHAKIEAPKLASGARNVVNITIDGAGQSAVEWLTELRRELQDIHNTFYGRVQPNEIIRCTCEVCRKATEMEVNDWEKQELIADYEEGDRETKCKKSRKRFQIANLLYGVYSKTDPATRHMLIMRGQLDDIQATTEDTNARVRSIEATLETVKTDVDGIKGELFTSNEEQKRYYDRIDKIIAALPPEEKPDLSGWDGSPPKNKVKLSIDVVKFATKVLNKYTGLEIEGLPSLKVERELKLPTSWVGFKRWFLEPED